MPVSPAGPLPVASEFNQVNDDKEKKTQQQRCSQPNSESQELNVNRIQMHTFIVKILQDLLFGQKHVKCKPNGMFPLPHVALEESMPIPLIMLTSVSSLPGASTCEHKRNQLKYRCISSVF